MSSPALPSFLRVRPLRPLGIVVTLALVAVGLQLSAPPAQAITNSAGKVLVDCTTADLLLGFDYANRAITSNDITLVLAKDCVYTVTGIYPGESINALPTFSNPDSKALIVEGNGATIQRTAGEAEGNRFRFLQVNLGKTVVLKDLTLRGGYTPVGWSGNNNQSKDSADGGAIYVSGGLQIENVTLENNKTGRGGYGSDSGANRGHYGGTSGRGGAIFNVGYLTVINSTITGNRTGDGGSGGFGFAVGGTGGGSGAGGGIANNGTMTMTGTEVTGNSVGNVGSAGNSVLGGTTSAATRGSGAGVFSSGSTASVDSSLFSGNITTGFGAYGGAIASYAAGLTVTNSTFVGNSSRRGGAIWVREATATVSNSTFVGNVAESDGDVTSLDYGSKLTWANSLFKGNGTREDCAGSQDGAASSYVSVGSLLSDETGSCGIGTASPDPLLGPLQDNGGPSRTMALLPGSPAIDTGFTSQCTPKDQRGVTRPQGSGCDVGAFEVGVNPPAGTIDGPRGVMQWQTHTYSSSVVSTGVPYAYSWTVSGVGSEIVGATTRTPSIRFTSPGTATITVRVYAAGGLIQEAPVTTATVEVGRGDNAAPAVQFVSPPTSAQQDSDVDFPFTMSDPDGDTVTALESDADCGGGDVVGVTVNANGGVLTCSFGTADAIELVLLMVTDKFGKKSLNAYTYVYVSAKPPVIEITGGPTSSQESRTPVTYSYTITVPGSGTPTPTTSCTGAGVTKRSGSDTLTGSSGTFTGTFDCYLSDGPATGVATVSYAGATVSRAVSVTNVAPSATIVGDSTVDENADATYIYEMAVSDAGSADGPQLVASSASCGANGELVSTAGSWIECRFPSGDTTTTVEGVVQDKDGTTTRATLGVTIANVAPLPLVEDVTAVEGVPVVVPFSAYDLGIETSITATVPEYCVVQGTPAVTDRLISGELLCTYPDGPATITSSITASDGTDAETIDFTVTVDNADPVVTYTTNTNTFYSGGDPIVLSADLTDTGDDTVGSWKVSWGDGTSDTYDDFTGAAQHEYPRPGGGPYSITVEVTDEDGTYSYSDARVRVWTEWGYPMSTLDAYDATSSEGKTSRFSFTVTDETGDLRPGTPSCGTNTPSFGAKKHVASAVVMTSATTGYWECTWGDAYVEGNRQFASLGISDDSPNTTYLSAYVTVYDTPPAFEWDPDNTVQIVEGDDAEYTYYFDAPDAGDMVRLDPAPTCGEGGELRRFDYSTDDAGRASFTCRWPDASAPLSTGPTLTLRTYGGFEETYTLPVSIVSGGPVVRVRGEHQALEGGSVTASFTVVDPDGWTLTGDPVCVNGELVSWSLDDRTVTCDFPDGPAAGKITVNATDGETPTSGSLNVTVVDVEPRVDLVFPGGFEPGEPWVGSFGEYTDPGDDTMQSIIVSWGDGTTTTYTSLDAELSHTYADPTYKDIDVTIVNEDGSFTFFSRWATSPDHAAPVMTIPEGALVETEATSASGAVAMWDVTAIDKRDGTVAVTCRTDATDDAPELQRASGDTYPLGDTPVHCSASDIAGNTANGYFTVRVVDTTKPIISTPTVDPTTATSRDGATVTFSVTATDIVSGDLVPTCVPASGSTFAIGTTTVECSQADGSGNTATAEFDVVVEDPKYPIVTAPADATAEATSAAGAQVSYSGATAIDIVDGEVDAICTPSSGSTFGLGETEVTCEASDEQGNTGSETFTVTVVDTTAPAFATASNIVADPTGPAGVAVTFTAPSAVDLVDGTVEVTCAPASGSVFPLGATVVSCSAEDSRDNAATTTFTVSVQDASAPVVTVPSAITTEATGPGGAAVSFASATAVDAVDGSLEASCTPASGTQFALGTTTVTCSATDAEGNIGSSAFLVTVEDTTPPSIVQHDDVTLEATGRLSPVSFDSPAASDLVDGSSTTVCAPESGSEFALGRTTVTCSASDSEGNDSSSTFSVIVEDTTAPVVTVPADIATGATTDAGAAVTFVASALDLVDGPVSVACEPASGTVFPRGATQVDCEATDAAGNLTAADFTVTVEGTMLSADAQIDDLTVEVATTAGFAPGDYVVINPGGPDEEVRYVSSIGSLVFDAPLASFHPVGTFVTTIAPPEDDTDGPVVEASLPEKIVLGSDVDADVTCEDPGVGVQGCRIGSVDSSTTGAKSLTVWAWDFNGNATTIVLDYTVVAAPVEPEAPAPGVSVPGVGGPGVLAFTGAGQPPVLPLSVLLLLSGLLVVLLRRRAARAGDILP